MGKRTSAEESQGSAMLFPRGSSYLMSFLTTLSLERGSNDDDASSFVRKLSPAYLFLFYGTFAFRLETWQQDSSSEFLPPERHANHPLNFSVESTKPPLAPHLCQFQRPLPSLPLSSCPAVPQSRPSHLPTAIAQPSFLGRLQQTYPFLSQEFLDSAGGSS